MNQFWQVPCSQCAVAPVRVASVDAGGCHSCFLDTRGICLPHLSSYFPYNTVSLHPDTGTYKLAQSNRVQNPNQSRLDCLLWVFMIGALPATNPQTTSRIKDRFQTVGLSLDSGFCLID